jgi:Zn-dependent protease with chaperone function
MYRYFIYFIVVLVIYSTYEPASLETVPWLWSLLGQGATFLVFALVCRGLFRRLEFKVIHQAAPASKLQKEHQALSSRLMIGAIILFAVHTYLFNLKFYLLQLALLKKFPSLSALLALAVFLLYLVAVWLAAFPSMRRLTAVSISRGRFLSNRIRLSLSILLPWFIITFFFDLVEKSSIPVLGSYPPFVREVVLFSLFLGAMVLAGPLLLKVVWGLKPLPSGAERTVIEGVCSRLKFKYRDIMLWPIFEGEVLTAGVMGLVSPFRYLMISPSLLKILEPEEIEAVIRHEIGHIRRHHLVYYIFFFLGYLVFIYPAFNLIYLLALGSETFHNLIEMFPSHELTFLSLFTAAPLVLLFIIYFRYIFGYFIRNFERQADLFSLKAGKRPEPLANSLEKIGYYSGNIRDQPSWHHYSIAERVAFLYRSFRQPELIRRHDRKVRASLLCYLLCFSALGYLGFSTQFMESGNRLEAYLVKKVLVRQVKEEPLDKEAWFALANVYYEAKEYQEAVQAYERVIEIDPEHAEALNNLAWLYATCPVEACRNPQEALRLAQEAASLRKLPHILDTLAESYYINGMYDEALDAIQQAISLGPDNLEYYQGQMEKFKKARKAEEKQGGVSSFIGLVQGGKWTYAI